MLGLSLVAAFLSISAAVAPPDWAGAPRVEVALSSFKYRPRTIRLPAGKPVVLHFVNTSGGGHDFTAPAFFAAAAVRPADRAALRGGRIDLKGGRSRDIALVPKAGRYKVRCTHTLHSALGMTGEIVVE
jgi:uncharacterized cupredoxin-like copper-binding protein